MNQQATLSGSQCDSQNGRGGLFFVNSVWDLLQGQTSPE